MKYEVIKSNTDDRFYYNPMVHGNVLPIAVIDRDNPSTKLDYNMPFRMCKPKVYNINDDDIIEVFSGYHNSYIKTIDNRQYLIGSGYIFSIDKYSGGIGSNWSGVLTPIAILGFLRSNYNLVLGHYQSHVNLPNEYLGLYIPLSLKTYIDGRGRDESNEGLYRILKRLVSESEETGVVTSFKLESRIKEMTGMNPEPLPKFREKEERTMYLDTLSKFVMNKARNE